MRTSRMGTVFTFMLVLCLTGCQGRPNFTNEQLLNRVLELEKIVEQLLKLSGKMMTSNTASSNDTATRGKWTMTEDILPTTNDEVGFHVALYNDVSVAFDEKIVFDTVEQNIGLAYKKTDAEFQCPISGTYLFALTIACQRDTYVEVYIDIVDVDGNSKNNILNTACDHRKRTFQDGSVLYIGNTQNGGTAIISLSSGDRVMVKRGLPASGLSTITGRGYSTFTGYLLKAY
ncbi:uncharacterized protein LOC132736466 isoform X2 [Ruditapes philippinarum]|uniref:uncharacterized protein LOC132736466 isoform X2 n=1 Tax=Ruditapes philippinarum TaxID=129788 RepID=UPI00295AD07F|nr:uncharacterized protein LOC132736466 isoform X2 [Ruditapes philippinarum]